VDWPKAVIIFDCQDAVGLPGKLARKMAKPSTDLNDSALRRKAAALCDAPQDALIAQKVLTQSFAQNKPIACPQRSQWR